MAFPTPLPDPSRTTVEPRLDPVIEHVRDGHFALDENWRFTAFNRASEAFFGRPREEVLGRNVWEAFPRAQGSIFEERYREAMAGEETVRFEAPSSVIPGRILEVRAFRVPGGLSVCFTDVTAERRAAQDLQENEERLRLALAFAGLGDWAWDAATDQVTFSPAASAIFRVPEGDLLTWQGLLRDRLHPDDRERTAQAVEAAAAQGDSYDIEYRVTHPGGITWVAAKGRARYRPDGTLIGMVGVVQDVSGRRREQEAMRRREAAAKATLAELEALYRALPVGVAVVDRDLRYVRVNQALADLNGLSTVEHIGRPLAEVIGEASEAEVAPVLRGVIETGEPVSDQEFTLTVGGSRRAFLENIRPLHGIDGAVDALLVTVLEITGRRVMEDALRAGEERLRLALASGLIGTFDYDIATRALTLDERCRAMFGLSPDAPVDHDTFQAALHPEDRDWVAEAIRQALDPATAGPFEAECRTVGIEDGQLRWVAARGIPFLTGGRVARFIGTVRDITRRRQDEERQTLLLGELNHRVKNTLATIQSIVRQTLRAESSPAEAAAALESRIIALSKTHNLLTEGLWQGADLAAIVRNELDAFGMGGRTTAKGPAIRLEPAGAVALGMAMHELATNAAKYGALSVPGGQVEVCWTREAGEGGPWLHLTWQERGGPPVSPPSRRGFGSRLLEAGLARQLGGRVVLSFDPEGLVCRISAPLGSRGVGG